ncbi:MULTISPECIES: ABC transporter substrate-binding protein [unclassified Actinotalea]|uniref:ABC transporter substrate-binding protein n=1 Tax=unclassified Actinotalea TaxID=2638618 RepID=UPI0015F4AD07|nr:MULTISPECIES: extracellular solute-binding protein [unclassified Actinotalea]
MPETHCPRPTTTGSRRAVFAGVGVLALALSACSGSTDPGDDGDVELRFSWWGSDARHEITQTVIDAYEAKNPGVTITPEYSDYGGYWDKLATTVAANDMPDVIQMDEKYLREYAGRGALLEIPESVDTSAIDPAALGIGHMEDGLFAIPAGINSFVVIANPAVFRDAGVELPDDSTWTWDDYDEIARQISENSPSGVYGAASMGSWDAYLNYFARQRGESLYTADGELGLSVPTVTEFWETVLRRSQDGLTPPPSEIVEDLTATVEQKVFAQNRQGMTAADSNTLNSAMTASGSSELVLLRPPSLTGKASENGAYYKGSMFWSISSRTEHPQEAAAFVDYLINSTEAAEVMLAERGAPPNSALREAIADLVSDADAATLAYIDEIADEVGEVAPPAPVGGGNTSEVLSRYLAEVLFERQTPAEAARAFIDEVNAGLG